MTTKPLLLSLLALPVLFQDQAPEKSQAELEADFAELLTNARLVGFTTLTGEEGLKGDSYTIKRASKQEDGNWRFEAVIEFGENEVPFNLSFPVEWAGDTPVITVTDMKFPMMGSYTARVLFHGDQYAGIWTGKGYGGQIFGRVEPIEKEVEPPSEGDGAPSGPLGEGSGEESGDWPSFRGPGASGVSDAAELPVEWHVDDGDNVLWRAELPGLAHSAPVIQGDRLFVTTAVRADGEQSLQVGLYGAIQPVEGEGEFVFLVYCLDKRTGEVLWEQLAWEGEPAIKRHTKGSHAAATPAVDAERVVVFFGSEGLYCYDHAGELQWEKSFGVLDSCFYMVPDAQWGWASSPVLHEGNVYVQCDVQGQSFVAALDGKTGEERWRTNREEVPTWCTPTVDVREGRRQLILNGWKHIGGYDLDTGAELWKLEGGGDIPVPTPIVAQDLIFITNAHGTMAPIYAIDPLAEGTLTIDPEACEAMIWSQSSRGNYMQTPLAYGEEIYFCSDAGILTCYDIGTGDTYYRERLGSGRTGFTGSGVAGDGKLYFTSEEGETYVVQAGPDFAILAENSLGEEFMSTPAISDGVIYFRSRTHLTAVAASAE